MQATKRRILVMDVTKVEAMRRDGSTARATGVGAAPGEQGPKDGSIPISLNFKREVYYVTLFLNVEAR